jgi:hypothetical protein
VVENKPVELKAKLGISGHAFKPIAHRDGVSPEGEVWKFASKNWEQ